MHSRSEAPSADLKLFWWVFAVRGGLALLFAGLLQVTASLFGTIFFDPIMLVFLTLLLGFYLVASGIVLAVAAGFAKEHRLGWWENLLADAIFALGLGIYIAISLFMTPHTLGLLAGLHALGIGFLQLAMAVRLRHDRLSTSLLGPASILSLLAGYVFVVHWAQPIRITAHRLSCFELLFAAVTLAFGWRLHARSSPAALLRNNPLLTGAL